MRSTKSISSGWWYAIFLSLSLVSQNAAADFGSLDGSLEIEALHLGASTNGPSFASLTNGYYLPQVRVYSETETTPNLVVNLNKNFEYLDLEPVNVSGTTTSLAVLAKSRNGPGLRIFRIELASGSISTSEPFGAAYDALDMEIGTMPDGSSVAFLLATSRAANRPRILFHHAGNLNSVAVERNISAHDLEFAIDPITNTPLLIVLSTVPTTKASRASVYDAVTKSRISTISFGRYLSVDLSVAQYNEELAISILRQKVSDHLVKVESKAMDGARIGLRTFPSEHEPQAFVERPTSLYPLRPAVLFVDPVSSRASVEFETTFASGQFQIVEFGSGSSSTSAIELSGVDEANGDIAVVQQHSLTGSLHVKVRTAANVRRKTIPLNTSDRVPDWFRHNRVHAHTRLSDIDQRLGLARSWYKTDQSLNAGAYFRELGVKVFTRHSKASNEDPWWSSMAPPGPNGQSRYAEARSNKGLAMPANANFTQGYIDEAWAAGLPMLAYYADSGEITLADEYGDWVCRKPDGTEATHPTKGRFLDLTTAYGGIVETRLLELADMGASGVYLDFRHSPANGCWSTKLAADYEAEFDVQAPPIGRTEEYRRYAEYYAAKTVEVIEGWKQAIKSEYPEFQLLVSVTSVPGLTRIDMSSHLASIDTPKSEFAVAVARGQSNSIFERFPDLHRPPDDIRQALGWSLLRDLAGEDLYHVWTAFMPNQDHVEAFVSSIIAYGGIAALDVVEELITPGASLDGIATREAMREGFGLGQALSNELGASTPMRWAAVHFSENARNAYITDTRLAWTESLLPTVASFEALRQQGIPVKVVTDLMLEAGELQDVQFLVVQNSDRLTFNAESAVQSFVANGGDVFRLTTEHDWATSTNYEIGKNLIAEAAFELAAPPAAFAVGLPEGVHVTFNRSDVDSGLIITALNKFDFVQATTIFDPLPISEVNPTPAATELGIQLHISQSSLPPNLTNNQSWQVTNSLDGTSLPYETTNEGILITLPSFDRVLQLVVR